MSKTRPALLMLLLATLIVFGCSNSGLNPADPDDVLDLSTAADAPGSNRMLWGIWDLCFDSSTRDVVITPTRNALAHFDITDWLLPPNCDDCFAVAVNSFDPVTRILDADVTLRNPTQLSGYDVRGILYTNDYGHLLKNADGWTDLWEMPGGDDINPFRAFAKTEANRIFIPDAEHTENYRIYIPMPPNWNQITFAVDASWPGNCKEPYGFENFQQEIIYDQIGSSGTIRVDVFDWQYDLSEVTLEAIELTGVESVPFTFADGNTWEIEYLNETPVAAGDYDVRVTAKSNNSGDLPMHQFFKATITEYNSIFNPVDITPLTMTFSLWELYIDGDYAYVTGHDEIPGGVQNGLHIIDISDPLNTVCVSSVETPADIWDVDVDNGYTYLAGHTYDEEISQLYVVDTNSVESPLLIKSVDIPDLARDVDVINGFAYVATWGGLVILDVDPPGDAHSIGIELEPGGLEGVVVSGDYAYTVKQSAGLVIFNIADPYAPFFVKSISTGSQQNWSLDVSGNYVYVVSTDTVVVIDISDPELAEVAWEVDLSWLPQIYDIQISGNYAYVSDWTYGMNVLDITDPESAYVLSYMDTNPYFCKGISVSGDYAYLAAIEHGLMVVDVSQPDSIEIVHTHYILHWVYDVEVYDGYAYVRRGMQTGGTMMYFLDIDPLESTRIIGEGPYGTFSPAGYELQNGYLFSADDGFEINDGYLYVFDVDPIEAISSVQTVEIPTEPSALGISDNYACVGYYDDYPIEMQGVSIIDIDPPDSANLLASVDTPGNPREIAVSGGYAYVISGMGEMQVIDIDPADSASIVHKVYTPGSGIDIGVEGDHAFLLYYGPYTQNDVLAVIDITSPETAHIIEEIITPGDDCEFISISNGYAYIGDGVDHGYLYIYDISPAESVFLVETIPLPMDPTGISLYENYAYVACRERGLRVFQLW